MTPVPVMESLWSKLGFALGMAYELYALFFLLFGLVGHPLVLLGYAWAARRGKLWWFGPPVELLYGLLNPLVYLLVFQPALFRRVTPGWLSALCWALLVAYWGARLVTSALPQATAPWRGAVRALLLCCLLLVVGVGLRDLAFTLLVPPGDLNEPYRMLLPLLVSPLYLLPALIAWHQWRLAGSDATWAERSLVASTRMAQAACRAVAVASLGTALLAHWRPAESATRTMLLAHRQDILAAAERARVDPRLLASIVFVTHREHTTPFRAAVEEVAAGAWLTDPKSHSLLANALDPSLGLAQVKPVTVLTAFAIQYKSAGGTWLPSKEYREVPLAGDALERIPTPVLAGVEPPFARAREGVPLGKGDVVRALLTPAQNLALAAYVLDLTAAQWEAANPAWDIRQRPDVLATLYQLGFQRSHPKPDPRPNAFGL